MNGKMRKLSERDKWTYNNAWIYVFQEIYEEFGTAIVIEDGLITAAGREEPIFSWMEE